MTSRRSIDLLGLVALVLFALQAPVALAQSGGGYELTWITIDTGGGIISGGAYSAVSNIGQAEASSAVSGGGYSLTGGVWGGPGAVTPPPGGKRVYLPVVIK